MAGSQASAVDQLERGRAEDLKLGAAGHVVAREGCDQPIARAELSNLLAARALGKRGLHLIDIREGMHGSAAGPGWLRRKMPVRRADEAVTE